jgi:hypothetical protein
MKPIRAGSLSLALLASTVASLFAQIEPQLGDAPLPPKDISGLPRRGSMAVTGGFTVNTSSREEVRSFYNAVYSASEGVPMNSSANVAACFAGTNAPDFMDAVLRRVNWYRAMAGIPASVMLNNMFNTNDQAAALMMSANSSLSHTPPPSWTCWTSYGSNAANNSNIAWNSSGPGAVTGYINDYGAGNYFVGHRRWILYPQTQLMGTGDVPDQPPYYEANALWVFDGHIFDPRPATRTGFVSWPPAGYVPYGVVFPRWSISYLRSSASSFSSATVTMRSNGVPISVALETVATGYGENTLVWVPMGLNANDNATVWPFNGADTVYTIGVSNVLLNNGATITNFNYTVTVFDPAVPGADYLPPTISGPSQPVVGQTNQYTFTAVTNATSYQWRYARKTAFSLSDGAETGLGNWTANISSGYSAIGTPAASGSSAFQLVHAQSTPQSLTLNPTIAPRTNTTLQFKSRLMASFVNEIARVQVSTDGGANWSDVYTQPGTGSSGEGSFTTKNVNLGSFAGSTLQVRFLYDLGPGSYYTGPASVVGWHFDDVVIANADQISSPVVSTVSGTNFGFNPPQAGDYNLQVRALIFTDFPLDWGPIKAVTATTNAPTVMRITSTSYSNNQVRIDFTLQSGSASSFKLLYANQVPGSWSTDAVAVLSTLVPGSAYRFTTTPSGGMRYYRIQSP